MDLFATNAYSLGICPVEFLLLSSIRTMKTPYGQTRGLYVYVANKSIHRFRVQKTTCNHYANFFADVKVIGQLFSQNSLNESLLFYNFSVKTIRMKVCYFTTFSVKTTVGKYSKIFNSKLYLFLFYSMLTCINGLKSTCKNYANFRR